MDEVNIKSELLQKAIASVIEKIVRQNRKPVISRRYASMTRFISLMTGIRQTCT